MFHKLKQRLIAMAKTREGRRALALYAVATWLSLGFLTYSVALENFLELPSWVTSTGLKQFSGPLLSLTTHGVGQFTHYRIQLKDSGELAIPPEIAYPLGPESPDPRLLLGNVIHEGDEISVTVSGGPFPVVLALEHKTQNGGTEKLLNLQDSALRYTQVRADARFHAAASELAALGLLPAIFLTRFLLAYRKRRALRLQAS